MKVSMKVRSALTASAVVLLLGMGVSTAYAGDIDQPTVIPPTKTPTTPTAPLGTADWCVKQVLAQVPTATQSDLSSACTIKEEKTEGPVETVTVAEAEALATTEGLSEADTTALVAAARAGAVKSKSWRHSYWTGVVREYHTGRTYWDGSRAWISKYRGVSGSHACHTEGSYSVGVGISPKSCSKPGPGSSADAVYGFDYTMGIKGVSVRLSVGLHYSVNRNGATSTWQVGG